MDAPGLTLLEISHAPFLLVVQVVLFAQDRFVDPYGHNPSYQLVVDHLAQNYPTGGDVDDTITLNGIIVPLADDHIPSLEEQYPFPMPKVSLCVGIGVSNGLSLVDSELVLKYLLEDIVSESLGNLDGLNIGFCLIEHGF